MQIHRYMLFKKSIVTLYCFLKNIKYYQELKFHRDTKQIPGALVTWQCADGVHPSIVGCEVMGLHLHPEELDVACNLVKATYACGCPYAKEKHTHRGITFLKVREKPSEQFPNMLGSCLAFHWDEENMAFSIVSVLAWVPWCKEYVPLKNINSSEAWAGKKRLSVLQTQRWDLEKLNNSRTPHPKTQAIEPAGHPQHSPAVWPL